ncbi:MAG: hypothetical protein R3B45_13370 [Bdellovibrionota bacterium]
MLTLALLIATSGVHAAQILGMPEIRITLAQVVTYLAASPKSNRSYIAIEKALEDVKKFGDLNVPFSLRNASTDYMKSIGYGKEYCSPHVDFDKAKTMKYLPDKLTGAVYYHPKDTGVEGQLKQNLTRLRPTKD